MTNFLSALLRRLPAFAAAGLLHAAAWSQAVSPGEAEQGASLQAASSSIDARIAALGKMSRFVPAKALAQLLQIEAEARMAPPRTRAEFLSQLCVAQIRVGNNDAALQLANQLIGDGERSGDKVVLAKGLLSKGYVMSALTERPVSHQLAYRAEQLANAGDDMNLRVASVIASGESRAEEGNFPAALIKLQTAVELARQSASPLLLSAALNSLAKLYDSMKEYDKGFDAVAEAVVLAKASQSPGELAMAKNSEYILAIDADQPQRARQALIEGLAIEQKLGAQRMIGKTLVNLSDSYLQARDYATTLVFANQAIGAARISNDVGIEAVARVNIGQALIGMGRIAEGKKSFDAGMTYYEKANNKPEIQAVLLDYGTALERAGVLDGAMDAYRRERKISNELFEQQRQKSVYELQERYEAERKQRQIELLSRENQVKGAEIENRRLSQRVWWLLMAVFALGALIVGILYRRVRLTNVELENKNLELKQQSARDPLTALYNRRHFHEFMRRHAAARGETVGAIFLLDVDHFKTINDSHGHAAGDAVLTMIADSMVELLRETDMIVRWGGEEFLAFLPAVRRDRIDEVAQRILDGIAGRSVDYQGQPLQVSVSVGFAPFPLARSGAPLSWERTVNLVDMALYLAKAGGRNRACGIRAFSGGAGGDDGALLEAIEKDLEQAWRAGHVDLGMVLGAAPAPRGDGAAEADMGAER